MKKEKIEQPLFIEGEIWLPITDFEGYYEISNFGRVASCERITCQNKKAYRSILQAPLSVGYPKVVLWKDGLKKQIRVHRLVAEHFIPNPLNKKQVNHINGIRTDNSVDNLEWASNGENQKHSYKYLGKTSHFIGKSGEESYVSKKVVQIDKQTKDHIKIWTSATEASLELGISRQDISRCCCGAKGRKSAGGFIWKFI